MAYAYRPFPYHAPPGLQAPEPRHPVVIIGAGPIGLALAIDLAQSGVPCVVVDDNDVVSHGSRAICWAKRTLEIFDRLGVGARMLAKGVTWRRGRNFHGATEVYNFDLLPEKGHKYPAFLNLQQYYVEQYLVERAQELDLIDLRFKNRVVTHNDRGDHVTLDIETPDGRYTLEAQYLCACDGARSPTRQRMGLPFKGQTFDEHFLIIDVELPQSPFASDTPERWFWFAPPFHPGQSALLHKQPDDIYRIDLQLGAGSDPQAEAATDKVTARVRAIVGDAPFRIDWTSVYKFRCARLDRFVHGRVIFAGDAAHVVSPFGARGGNGGIQDVDNLGWKLALILAGGPQTLLDSYEVERGHGTDENILNSTRATNFMTPKSRIEALFRDEVLRLAHHHDFARRMVNSGRLSAPCTLGDSALQTHSDTAAPVPPGTAMIDAPLTDGWLIEAVQGRFVLVGFGDVALPQINGLDRLGIGHSARAYPTRAPQGDAAFQRYGTNLAYLFRPDGHVAAVFDAPTESRVTTALTRAKGQEQVPA